MNKPVVPVSTMQISGDAAWKDVNKSKDPGFAE